MIKNIKDPKLPNIEEIFNKKYLCEQMRKPNKSKKLPRFSYEDIDINNNVSEIQKLYIV